MDYKYSTKDFVMSHKTVEKSRGGEPWQTCRSWQTCGSWQTCPMVICYNFLGYMFTMC